MLRTVVRLATCSLSRTSVTSRLAAAPRSVDISALSRNFSSILRVGNGNPTLPRTPLTITAQCGSSILNTVVSKCAPIQWQYQPVRTVIKFSMRCGKRKSVKPVIKRFKRLDWGGWIRTKAGRHKHMWKKSAERKRRLRQHVLVNSQQATLLDKMVTKYWKRPRYYINDPYTPYHTREEFRETRRKPLNYGAAH